MRGIKKIVEECSSTFELFLVKYLHFFYVGHLILYLVRLLRMKLKIYN